MSDIKLPKPRIPAHAVRAFKGVIFDVYQWEQELYDGRKTVFEMLRRPSTVMVLATEGDKVLLARQEQPGKAPYYDYLGGRADEGEEPLETAKRELLEESGMVSDDWELWAVDSFPGKIEWFTFYFIARSCHKVTEPKLDGGEKVELVRIAFDDFVNTIVTDPSFYDHFTRHDLFSLYNPAKAEDLAAKLFKGTK